jgi:oxygen-independent coproporphyrinogen-3 oxidase
MDSIYIGGGTPNSLNNVDLFNLLNTCKKLCSTKTEFTIECNPEFINQEQIDIFKKNKINRISLGVQFANDKLLKQFGRKHDVQKCVDAIKLLQSNKINNISCDFIYGINELTNVIIKKDLEFIYKNKIPHCSFYSLELKHNSKLTKDGYKINEEFQEQQLQYIEKNIKYKRYEVSN